MWVVLLFVSRSKSLAVGAPSPLHASPAAFSLDAHVAAISSCSPDGERCPRVVLIKPLDSGAPGLHVDLPVVSSEQAQDD